MKYSITGKITAIMLSLVAGTVLLCWFINTTLLETYYVEHKQQKLLETYEMVNKASSSGEAWTEEFAIRLEKVCANSNITRMIIGSDNIILDSNVGDDETLLLQFLELIFRKNKNVSMSISFFPLLGNFASKSKLVIRFEMSASCKIGLVILRVTA